jgi:CheY-like chemotaxis protein
MCFLRDFMKDEKPDMKTRQLNVLIVDPDVDARECLRDLLEAEGYATMSAPPGTEALYMVRQTDAPCIVLLNKIGTARTSLQHLAVLEHEQDVLMVALDVLNQNGESARARLRAQHPIRGLVKTSAEPVARYAQERTC